MKPLEEDQSISPLISKSSEGTDHPIKAARAAHSAGRPRSIKTAPPGIGILPAAELLGKTSANFSLCIHSLDKVDTK